MLASKIIVRISSNESSGCPLCEGTLDGFGAFENACNHLLQDHGLKCIHVGQETVDSDTGPWQTTIAVFGE